METRLLWFTSMTWTRRKSVPSLRLIALTKLRSKSPHQFSSTIIMTTVSMTKTFSVTKFKAKILQLVVQLSSTTRRNLICATSAKETIAAKHAKSKHRSESQPDPRRVYRRDQLMHKLTRRVNQANFLVQLPS